MTGVSVIIPLHERCEPLEPLYREYAAPLIGAGFEPEFLFVAGPERAAQADEAERLRQIEPSVRVLRVAQPTGPAMLTRVGASEASHETLWQHSKRPRRCDKRRLHRSGDRKRGHRRVF